VSWLEKHPEKQLDRCLYQLTTEIAMDNLAGVGQGSTEEPQQIRKYSYLLSSVQVNAKSISQQGCL
jgi:hypothetical protein